MDMPKPISRFLMLIAKGVASVISKIILSMETKYKIKINKKTGVIAPQSTLCFTTKYKLMAINKVLMR
jgi:hypothetical protein